MTNIEKIKRSIQNQIDHCTTNYYKDVQRKDYKHSDGTEMWKVDNHKQEAFEIALRIIEEYE